MFKQDSGPVQVKFSQIDVFERILLSKNSF